MECTDIAVKTLSSKLFMSESLSLGDPNEGVTLYPISKGERVELSLTKCHHKIVSIGLEDAFLSIEIPSVVEMFINLTAIFMYCL